MSLDLLRFGSIIIIEVLVVVFFTILIFSLPFSVDDYSHLCFDGDSDLEDEETDVPGPSRVGARCRCRKGKS